LKKLALIVVAAVVVLAGVWLWRLLFPSDEARIRQILRAVAETASVKANTHPLVRLGGANKLAGFFTRDVVVEVDGVPVQLHSINGREELIQAVTAARASVEEVKVEFLDVQVTVEPDGQTASAHLTALAHVTGSSDPYVQETRMRLVKTDEGWKISRVTPVRTPRLE
jgi:ketosteroid isomerase-like protein